MIDIKELQDLQDLAWRSLSGEFKEVVKNYYQYALKHYQISSFQRNVSNTLERLLGTENLTSDAEGEEILTISRKRVQEMYAATQLEGMQQAEDVERADHYAEALRALFGEKCLPDNVDSSEPNVDSSHGKVESLAPKPSEQKYQVNDKVKVKETNSIGTIIEPYSNDVGYRVYFNDGDGGEDAEYSADELIYYDGPKSAEPNADYMRVEGGLEASITSATTEESDLSNLSQEAADCDKQFGNILTDMWNAEIDHFVVKNEMVDNIIKDGFRNHNRLHIAAILATGMLASEARCYPVDRALELADKLIAECEKGGQNEPTNQIQRQAN